MKHFSSPHIHGGNTIRAEMLQVMLALLPVSLFSVYMYGWLAVLLFVFCMGSAVLFEIMALAMMRRPLSTAGDGSAALTGLFLALVMPPFVPWWMTVLGAALAILMCKQIYGGIGYNLFNPALAARVVLLISFPVQMTTWISPMPLGQDQLDLYSLGQSLSLFFMGPESLSLALDDITQASPLGHVKTMWTTGVGFSQAFKQYDYGYVQALLGSTTGSLGESSALLLLLGGAYLLRRGVISWHIPFSFLLTVAALALVFHLIDAERFAPAPFHLLGGGLMLGAFFMATDPVSSPVTPMGKIVFGVGCGLITWVIRTFGGYPEGVMFSIVLMNCTVPLIDHYTRPRVYGRASRP